MARQIFEENGASAGSTGNGSGGGNANVYITIPNVDIKEILLIGAQAKVRVSASTFDVDNRVVFFDLRVGNTQMLLDAVKDGKMWTAEYTFTVTGQSGDRLAIFCNAIDQNNLRSMTGTPAISPRLTQSRIAAPVITSPAQDEYKTAGSIVIKGTEFVSLGASDTHKAVHGRVVLADDPQIIRWEGSLAGALTQITAAWTPAGDGQEDLLCSLAYEGYSGGMGEWSEPVRVRLVKSGVSVPVIVWPLNGEKYADPNLLRVNAEQPTVKSNSWTGTEWQVSDTRDFTNMIVVQTITDTDCLPNRVMTDLTLDGRLGLHLYLRCRHLTNVGPTAWSAVVEFDVAEHQTFWEFTASGTFSPPVPGAYEVLCVGAGGAGGASNSGGGGGGGGSGYLSIGDIYLDAACSYNMDTVSTRFSTIVANGGSAGVSFKNGIAPNGGAGANGGGGGGTNSIQGSGGLGIATNGGSGTTRGSNENEGGQGGGDGAGKGSRVAGVTVVIAAANGSGYGAGQRGQNYTSSQAGSGGGGAGGYGGGTTFPLNNYYSMHLPYKNFNNVNAGGGYIRIMYKGPIGEGA